ncbi:MAG: pentapeptide repeat-containing protein [Gammaproteobacteria bacterium]
MIKSSPDSYSATIIGARKGATGTRADLTENPPVPKSWVSNEIIDPAMTLLKERLSGHSRLDLYSIIHHHLFDQSKSRYRMVWSKNMITAAGVSAIKTKNAADELVLHFRDGEEERKDDKRWMRQILQSLHKKGGRVKEAVEDFVYLTLVHEASEIHQRKQAETLLPDIKAEIRAEIEEAKAYFSLPGSRRKVLQQLYKLLDETTDPRLKVFTGELEVFESIGEERLGSIEGLLTLIEFVVGTPDYAREANIYHDERTRLQLARSLFVDVLHDFAGASRADKWVMEVEKQGAFGEGPVKFKTTENSAALSEEAAETLVSAANLLKSLKVGDAEIVSVPGDKQKRRAISGFNKKIEQLDPIKQRLALDEVLSVPEEFKAVLEDNELNRHFSYMDRFGIYHSLNLSRLDLRGLNLHSGDDERSKIDRDRQINFHKDERSDLRGAHMVGSDFSGAANFSSAQMDFAIAAFSDFTEVVFTRARAIGMVLYGANANEGQFERAKMTAVDARGMSASFARIQMEETDINGMKIWQSDVPGWQRAYVDISRKQTVEQETRRDNSDRESLKSELDFLDDSFLDELDAINEAESAQGEENWIELREIEGQLELLKGRGVVFYSRDETLEYSDRAEPSVEPASAQSNVA